MAQIREVIERALAKIGVARGEVDGDQTSDGLFALNAMMHAWKLRGVDIEHVDLSSTDEFPLSPEFLEGTIYLLAGRLSPDYVAPPMFDADDWFRTFQAAYAVDNAVDMNSALTNMPSQRLRRFVNAAS